MAFGSAVGIFFFMDSSRGCRRSAFVSRGAARLFGRRFVVVLLLYFAIQKSAFLTPSMALCRTHGVFGKCVALYGHQLGLAKS